MLVIIIILMTKVMPVFDQVFRQFGQEMTGFSRGILLAGNALSRYSAVFAVLLAVIVCAGIYFTQDRERQKETVSHRIRVCIFKGADRISCRHAGLPEECHWH